MHRKVFLALVVVCCLSATAFANPTIIAGNWTINPAAGQSVDAITALPIEVLTTGTSPTDDPAGVDLALNVSGPSALLFTVVDIVGVGTIFGPNNTGQTDFLAFGGPDQFSLTTTTSGTVPINGTLAFITFDASGTNPGEVYTFSLTNFIGTSDLPPFFPPFVVLVAGTVTIIPEPGSIVLALFAAGGLCAVVIRRRRKVA